MAGLGGGLQLAPQARHLALVKAEIGGAERGR
jgi:hypothetical protein